MVGEIGNDSSCGRLLEFGCSMEAADGSGDECFFTSDCSAVVVARSNVGVRGGCFFLIDCSAMAVDGKGDFGKHV